MIFNILILFISIILELLVNLYINTNSYFIPLFTLLSLIFIYPYFKNSKRDFYILSVIIGFIYDIVFTNFYILNALIFLLISNIIYYYFKKFNYKLLNIILLSIILVLVYNFILFIIFNIYRYNMYTLFELIYILKHFFIVNIIYIFIIYLIYNKLYLKNIS